MHRIPVLFLLCLITSTSNAQILKKNDIDIAYNKCVAKDSSCANVGSCAFMAYAGWEKQMEAAYGRLLKQLKKDEDKTALEKSQTAWMAYRDATFASYDMMFNLPGNKWCLQRHNDRIAIVRARTTQLREYLDALKKKK